MNELPDNEIVDLGDVKEETQGPFGPILDEDDPVAPYRPL
jgi:hypothetical protein